MVPSFSWTGAEAGLLLGYGWADDGIGTTDGIVGGGYIGYNWQLPSNLVFGAEAVAVFTDFVSNDFIATFRGRIGYAFDRFMIFGTGGLALADPLPGGDTEVGFAAGGGLQMAFTDNIVGRVEYQYVSVDNLDANQIRVGLGFKF
jgi:outer membrane immunogenic protein